MPAKKKSKIEKNKIRPNLITYIGIGFIVLAALGYLIFYGYNVYKQSKIDNYNRRVSQIQTKSNKEISLLNASFKKFFVSPDSAKKLAPKFKKAADITKRASLALKTINPPKENQKDHKKLAETYEKGSGIYSDLHKLCEYIVKRDNELKSLIGELKNFSSKISKSKGEGEALKVASNSETKLNKSIVLINKLKSPIKLYDETLLVKYVKSLKNHLSDLQEALADKNVSKVELALYNIQKDYNQDWQKAFFNTDKKAINRYDQRVEKIKLLYD
ncbi:MAG: hypothetical protein E3J54_03695 [Actinobacteria bacterium]|nr:MAG: hypothetical protein E3J54_03695 [Actinomycetota bacterium]